MLITFRKPLLVKGQSHYCVAFVQFYISTNRCHHVTMVDKAQSRKLQCED